MIPTRKTGGSYAGERGTSLVELLVTTTVGLGLAAMLGHTVTAYQTHYRHAVTRMNGDQQAQFALALMADELASVLAAPASTTCPPGGVHVADRRPHYFSISLNLLRASSTNSAAQGCRPKRSISARYILAAS